MSGHPKCGASTQAPRRRRSRGGKTHDDPVSEVVVSWPSMIELSLQRHQTLLEALDARFELFGF